MANGENRKSFFDRLRAALTPRDLMRVELAYTLSKYHHRAQERRGVGPDGEKIRYFEHPRFVALIAIVEVGIIDADLICILLLHDTVEDTDLTLEMIEHVFGHEVALGVRLLSKEKGDDGYFPRLAASGVWRALVGKMCDRTHNNRTMAGDSKEKQESYLRETEEKIVPLMAALRKTEHYRADGIFQEQAEKLGTLLDASVRDRRLALAA